jgi:hypothetical protein
MRKTSLQVAMVVSPLDRKQKESNRKDFPDLVPVLETNPSSVQAA